MLASFAFYFFRIHLLAGLLLTNTSTRLLYFKLAKALCSHLNRNDLWTMQSCCFFVIVNVSFVTQEQNIYTVFTCSGLLTWCFPPPPISFSSLLFVLATILWKYTPNIIEVKCSCTMLYNWTSPQHDMHRLHFSAQTHTMVHLKTLVCLPRFHLFHAFKDNT